MPERPQHILGPCSQDIPTLARHRPTFSEKSNGTSSDRGIQIRAVTGSALRRRSRAGFSPASPMSKVIIAQVFVFFNQKQIDKHSPL